MLSLSSGLVERDAQWRCRVEDLAEMGAKEQRTLLEKNSSQARALQQVLIQVPRSLINNRISSEVGAETHCIHLKRSNTFCVELSA